MKFKVDPFVNINGTGKVGTLNMSFYELVDLFGPPVCGPSADQKTQCEWHIEFEDGTVATIYDYKLGEIPIEQINYWHVGGSKPAEYGKLLLAIEELRMDDVWIKGHV